MEQIEAGAYIENKGGEYIIKPRSVNDKILLDTFTSQEKGSLVNLRLMKRVSGKTYEQTKAFWALVTMYFELYFNRKPNEVEREQFYEEHIMPAYLPKKPSIMDSTVMIPKRWSELTVAEGIKTIEPMIADIAEAGDVPDSILSDCKGLFEWFQNRKNNMYKDPCDYGEDGLPLSKAEWADKNKICMVTGVMGGDICHIVSRQMGVGHEWLVNQSWNFYRADHRIHINVQHMQGWDALFKMAPHLKPRYERAFKLYYKGVSLINQGYTEEEITRHLAYSERPEDDVPIEKGYNLAEMALED